MLTKREAQLMTSNSTLFSIFKKPRSVGYFLHNMSNCYQRVKFSKKKYDTVLSENIMLSDYMLPDNIMLSPDNMLSADA
jgi:hypothetical protein